MSFRVRVIGLARVPGCLIMGGGLCSYGRKGGTRYVGAVNRYVCTSPVHSTFIVRVLIVSSTVMQYLSDVIQCRSVLIVVLHVSVSVLQRFISVQHCHAV